MSLGAVEESRLYRKLAATLSSPHATTTSAPSYPLASRPPHAAPPPANRQSARTPAVAAPRWCPRSRSNVRNSPRCGCPNRPPRHPPVPAIPESAASSALPLPCQSRSSCLQCHRALVDSPALVARIQPVQLHHNRLRQRRNRARFFHFCCHVAHAELQRAKHRMRPHIPPDFLRIIDAVQLHQQICKIFVFTLRAKMLRQSRPRKSAKHRRPVGL